MDLLSCFRSLKKHIELWLAEGYLKDELNINYVKLKSELKVEAPQRTEQVHLFSYVTIIFSYLYCYSYY